jgi:hypothetical protein
MRIIEAVAKGIASPWPTWNRGLRVEHAFLREEIAFRSGHALVPTGQRHITHNDAEEAGRIRAALSACDTLAPASVSLRARARLL